ncbi:hypothetical protein N7456_010204 [Penicillium angulare]|uniref:Uncharacterized protein n=1 Tax=Penicillium angulare TaxID=116970 RepID=A0A9W9F657_9EURO|nr:hypothetical protein N7456_010204 [Penicillium angulare]
MHWANGLATKRCEGNNLQRLFGIYADTGEVLGKRLPQGMMAIIAVLIDALRTIIDQTIPWKDSIHCFVQRDT